MLRNSPQRKQRATKAPQHKSIKKIATTTKKVSKRNMTTSTTHVMSMDEIFTAPTQRTYRSWKAETVPGSVVKKAYDQIKFGPTAFNSSPLRITVFDTPEAKKKLIPFLISGNVPSVENSPVTAVLSYDSHFNDHFDYLSPGYSGAADWFKAKPEAILPSAQLNANLQAGYLITALRAQGLDVSPANGFDSQGFDAALLAPNDKSKHWKSFMYVNLGHADRTQVFPRAPRFNFEDISSQV